MAKRYDVIIIGGGVIGCSIAFQLSKLGRSILVIEKDTIASKSSHAAAGMLGLETEDRINQETSLFKLAKKSRDMFPTLQKELEKLSGIDMEYSQNGFLKIAQTDEELLHLHQENDHHHTRTTHSAILNSREIKTLEPSLSKTIKGGLYAQKGANISAKKLTKGFANSAAELGVLFSENTEVSKIITRGDEVIGVQTCLENIYADEVIVAAGAWSKGILRKNKINLQTYPVKGECLSVQTNSPFLTKTIFSKDCYIVPKPGGKIVIGATEIPDTFNEQVNLDSISKLINLAVKLIPRLKETKLRNVWSGIRPQTITGKPYVERNSFFKNLTIATGHYRNGILLAPVTGVLVAELLEGKKVGAAINLRK